MYWNVLNFLNPLFSYWLIETWDVLKSSYEGTDVELEIRLIETWDVLKFDTSSTWKDPQWLIETWDVLKFISCDFIFAYRAWLIETWDVLKWSMLISFASFASINRNMRCIEITVLDPKPILRRMINRNMRCIEILQYFEVSYLNKKQYFKILHQRLYGISKI